jgi:cell division transport system ATP-binding protein
LVRLERIGKRYGRGSATLSDVSLTLEAGGFYLLSGASGAGKTTLMKIIALAEPPSSGKLTLFGSDAGALDRAARAALRRRIGMIFQDCRLIDGLPAADNVALPLRIAGVAVQRINQNVPELLAWMGLAECGDAPVGLLSAGERRRVAIARAIVGRPELLIADEPTGNLDDEAATALVGAFQQLNRLGTTVLIAARDSAVARQFAPELLHLDCGTLSPAPAQSAP